MKELEKYQLLIEKAIAKNSYGKNPPSLYAPIQYLMGIGGKRLRPMLTLLAYSLFKENPKAILRYAIAVEAFHNFTLMHDDIMDDAPLRRGHATVHEKWNVNTSILSGDVMLVKVYELFCDLEPTLLKEVLKAFNTCAAEVCEGQQWDMEFEQTEDVSEAQYMHMIRQKTAVLLGFSLELGAILGGATPAQRKALREFGINIGIGFQLKDDLMDAYADPKKFGKQIGGDILANKKTWLLINAREKSKGKQRRLLEEWLAKKSFKKQEKIDAVKSIYDSLALPALVEKKINQYFKKGFKNLDALEAKPSSTMVLRQFAESLIERQS